MRQNWTDPKDAETIAVENKENKRNADNLSKVYASPLGKAIADLCGEGEPDRWKKARQMGYTVSKDDSYLGSDITIEIDHNYDPAFKIKIGGFGGMALLDRDGFAVEDRHGKELSFGGAGIDATLADKAATEKILKTLVESAREQGLTDVVERAKKMGLITPSASAKPSSGSDAPTGKPAAPKAR